jgi:hypothetical protein
MSVSPKYFAPLPDVVLDTIFAFAMDGPLKLEFDVKKQKFVDKPNKNFTLLHKALQFKIDNPPHWDVEDPNFDYEIGTTELDIIETLTFTFPFKHRIREGHFYEGRYRSKDGYLELSYSFSMSFNGYRTTKCEISLPMSYHKDIAKAAAHYKNQCKKNLSKKDFYHCKYMYKAFKTFKNYDDIVFV